MAGLYTALAIIVVMALVAWAAIVQGKKSQRADDQEETIDRAKKAAEVHEEVTLMSDAARRAKLHESLRDRTN